MKIVSKYSMWFIIFAISACSLNGHLIKPSETPSVTTYIPIVQTVTNTQIKTVHDTIRVKRPVTSQSKQDSAISGIVNKYFAPTFNRLIQSNQSFADIITSMRKRAIAHSDSMQASNSKYIKQAIDYQAQSIKYQQEALEARKDYDAKIQEQIKSNDRLTVVCLVGIITLFGIVVSLFLYCRSRFKKLDKILAHV